MPSDLIFKVAGHAHRALLEISGGRLGWTMGKMPVVELTTTGRRTGEIRSTLLTTWKDGDRMVIIASAGGNDRHPAWFLNLEANPAVTVRTADATLEMTARITSGEERTRLWDTVSSKYPQYRNYEGRTDREIPVVVLEPAH